MRVSQKRAGIEGFISWNEIQDEYIELEACGRLVCCAQRLCRSGSATEEAEQRINRGRRGAQAGPELEGPSGSEDGILPIPVSPSPASTSSQEDACKPPPRNCYRLVMLGSARVGKTAIVARFLSNKFEESYTPTIEDFHRKLYRIKGEVHQLDLLDTSGNHPFPAMRRLSFLTGDLFVVVFSLDCRESFEEAIRLRESILETKVSATQSATKSRSKSHFNLKVPMVIVGNKCDKDTKIVTVEEAEEYCNSQDDCCVFVEASAKRNYHVEELFYQLFVVAGLPLEMAPNHHRKVPLTFGSPTMLPPSQPRHKATLSIKRRLSDACGVVAPNVRRPSIRTDLMIMRTKTCSLAAGNENNAPGSRITLRADARKTCSIQ
ncbi:dexamethasone-induced Ras-related protein 1 isoform X1 [Apis mellifera caucasica]|uniref:Dexamethasone-induced Ras-related protein 1 isoform X1 n=2 Tax=Apis mellifera TaxID=7460 RepID=A0A7M7INN1_APIME|nr:dexamethasone-induced Ras-related protein 1 isoform X1 [Apis mellifera]KAG6803818.1 dexamethasone-induced Ras-related protein 1 isoform X1 [Apis mellifera caucasica]KAG9437384.1 dexamethasone-induced Ras-related protein 1 isoform X1 [Apis mellifera carnica]|eukprot:XP_016770201.1 dexamethasone-induced Ras-related protein 1 isoform X1 [Apis mellifera]